MALIRFIQKTGINLFFYFLKGARIDAALKWHGRMRINTGFAYPKPGAKLIKVEGHSPAYDANDIIRRWRIVTQTKLILKNNSKNFAYNIEIINGHEIFDKLQRLEKLVSLSPNESLELDAEFVQTCYEHSGLDADKLPDIPKDKENQILRIRYENEAGTKFITKFWVTFSRVYNEYTT